MPTTRSGSRQESERSPAGAEPPSNGASVSGSSVLIDLEFVRALIAAVDDSGIDSLEISRGGTRVRISKSPIPSSAVALPAAQGGPTQAASAAPGATAEIAAEPVRTGPVLVEIKSPMVGTFYRAPAPEAPAYVEVGAHVSRGQTLCILEAMKLMNEMESEVDGIVREILVENADPVEYGQVLFRVEPSGAA